jgi:hypothetical protein
MITKKGMRKRVMEANVRNRMWKGSEAGEYKEIKFFCISFP